MKSLVVVDRSAISDGLRWLQRAMPALLRRLLFVTPERIDLPGSPRPHRNGSVCLALGPEFILRQRLTLPTKARRHLAGAVRLLIETETPFSVDELLVHAEQRQATPGSGEIAYELRMVPRAAVFEAARQLGIGRGRIVRITDATAPEQIDFWPAAFPARRVMRWAPLLPLIIVTLVAGVMGGRVLAEQRSQVAAMEAAASDQLAELRAISKRVDTLLGSVAGEQAISSALEKSPSVYNMLQEVRRLLPNDAQLVRIQLRQDELRLTLKAPNVLATSRVLGDSQSSASWSAEIEGPITADPATGLEQGTVLLRSPGAET